MTYPLLVPTHTRGLQLPIKSDLDDGSSCSGEDEWVPQVDRGESPSVTVAGIGRRWRSTKTPNRYTQQSTIISVVG